MVSGGGLRRGSVINAGLVGFESLLAAEDTEVALLAMVAKWHSTGSALGNRKRGSLQGSFQGRPLALAALTFKALGRPREKDHRLSEALTQEAWRWKDKPSARKSELGHWRRFPGSRKNSCSRKAAFPASQNSGVGCWRLEASQRLGSQSRRQRPGEQLAASGIQHSGEESSACLFIHLAGPGPALSAAQG